MNGRSYSLVTDEFVERRTIVQFPEGSRPKVCLFATFNERYAPLAAIAEPNWKAYCEQHGYGLRFYPDGYHEDQNEPKTYGDKGKFQWYFELRGECDIVAFLDIDSLFVDMTPEIHYFADDRFVHNQFTYGYDENGPNSTFWIAKTDDETERCLRYAYEYAAANNHVRHGNIEPNGMSDQDAFAALMHVPPFRRILGYPVSWDELGIHKHITDKIPWIVTFAGLSLEDKKREMLRWTHMSAS